MEIGVNQAGITMSACLEAVRLADFCKAVVKLPEHSIGGTQGGPRRPISRISLRPQLTDLACFFQVTDNIVVGRLDAELLPVAYTLAQLVRPSGRSPPPG